MKRLMIVDGSEIVRKVGRRILGEMDYLVSEASNAGEALAHCRADVPDVAVIDASVDGALELMPELRKLAGEREMRIVYCLVENDLKKMMAAKRAGATDFLLKPFDRRSLMAVFSRIDTAA